MCRPCIFILLFYYYLIPSSVRPNNFSSSLRSVTASQSLVTALHRMCMCVCVRLHGDAVSTCAWYVVLGKAGGGCVGRDGVRFPSTACGKMYRANNGHMITRAPALTLRSSRRRNSVQDDGNSSCRIARERYSEVVPRSL